MSDRTAILAAIRTAAGARDVSPSEIAAQAALLVAEPAVVQPDFGGASHLERFIAKATSERVTASVVRVTAMADIPAAAQEYLEQNKQEMRITLQPTPCLEQLDWGAFDQTGTLVEDGGIAVTVAEYGIAETGSVFFRSNPDAPVLLNFLPLFHIVVLKAENILAYPEDLWPLLAGSQARLLTLITGTSGTADIEARNVRGAHGPKNMHIILVFE